MRPLVILLLAAVASNAQKVDVRFYGESLCPDCTRFTVETLKPVFANGLGLLTDFKYIGWGNVKKRGSQYVCQHGPLECKLNTVLNCGQAVSTSQAQFFDFLFCIESQAGPNVEAQIPGCAKAANIALERLETCYNGREGGELDRKARETTDSLQPAHTYVPWVTVNGIPLYDKVDQLASYICVAYNGTRPAKCYSESLETPQPKPSRTSRLRQVLAA